MSLEWSPAFSVGIEELDGDHAALMGMINEIECLIGDGHALRQAIERYSRQMARHAAREVGVLERYGYEGARDMAEAHGDLTASFDRFVRISSSGNVPETIHAWLDYQSMWMKVLTTISMDYRKFFISRGIVPAVAP